MFHVKRKLVLLFVSVVDKADSLRQSRWRQGQSSRLGPKKWVDAVALCVLRLLGFTSFLCSRVESRIWSHLSCATTKEEVVVAALVTAATLGQIISTWAII